MAGLPPEPPSMEEERAFAIEPTALGRPSRRSSWALRLGTLGVAVLVAVAALGRFDVFGPPPGEGPLAVATPGLTASPSPTDAPSATPRPTRVTPRNITVGVGPRPTRPIPVLHYGLVTIDPATGVHTPVDLPGPPHEVLVDGRGQLVCVCLTPSVERGTAAGPPFLIARFDPTTGLVVPGPTIIDGSDFRFGAIGDLSADGERLAVLSTTFAGASHDLRLSIADVRGRQAVGSVSIAQLPSRTFPGWPDGEPPGRASAVDFMDVLLAPVWFDLSPDGRTADIRVRASTMGSLIEAVELGWVVDIDADGRPGEVRRLEFDERDSLFCLIEGYVSADRWIRICTDPLATDVAALEVVVERADGSAVGLESMPFGMRSGQPDALADRASDRAFVWQPRDHTLVRFDARSATFSSTTVAPEIVAGRVPRLPGIGPIGDPRAVWRRLSSQGLPAPRSIIGSLDGHYLYALGGAAAALSDPDASGLNVDDPVATGIWVFDTETLELVDHWPAAANYRSIGLIEDGSFVAAVGGRRGGPDGAAQLSGESLAVHHARTGALAMLYGQHSATPIRLLDPAG